MWLKFVPKDHIDSIGLNNGLVPLSAPTMAWVGDAHMCHSASMS